MAEYPKPVDLVAITPFSMGVGQHVARDEKVEGVDFFLARMLIAARKARPATDADTATLKAAEDTIGAPEITAKRATR